MHLPDKIQGLLQLISSNQDLGYVLDLSPAKKSKSNSTDSPHSTNYQKLLEDKFKQLIQIQEQEQLQYQDEVTQHAQLKQALANCIRQNHIIQSKSKSDMKNVHEFNQAQLSNQKQLQTAIQAKQNDLDALVNAIHNLEQTFPSTSEDQTDMEELGSKLEAFQVEAQVCKEKQTQSQLVIEEKKKILQSLQQRMNAHKQSCIQSTNKFKANQAKLQQLQIAQQVMEDENEKVVQEVEKLKPKLDQKAQKIQEYDQLKQKMEGELSKRQSELADLRKVLKRLEEELGKTSNFEKLIKAEKKAEEALNLERKLLLKEFERICRDAGIQKKESGGEKTPKKENADARIKENQECLENQMQQIQIMEHEVVELRQVDEMFKERKSQLLEQYDQLERSMEELGKKFTQLSQQVQK